MKTYTLIDPLNADEYAHKFWQKNSSDERKKIHNLLKEIIELIPHFVGVGLLHIIVKNDPLPSFHNKTVRRVIEEGHHTAGQVMSNHHTPDLKMYKNLSGIELARLIPSTDEDEAILGFGVLGLFSKEKFCMKDYLALADSVKFVKSYIKKDMLDRFHWPELPAPVIDYEEIKAKAISKIYEEIEAKQVKGIMYQAEDLAPEAVDQFEKTYGSKHVMAFPDGTYIGVPVLKGNGQPWRNFLGLRPDSVRALKKDSSNDKSSS